MGIEIERKYLVDKLLWEQLAKPAGELYRQGYLLSDPAKTIRVRLTPKAGYLTIKGLTVGASRPEYEYEIPVKDAAELLDSLTHSEISKTRYRIKIADKIWEVDEFLGQNEGLIIAEIELITEEESFAKPSWVSSEVTHDARYYNSNLAVSPYTSW